MPLNFYSLRMQVDPTSKPRAPASGVSETESEIIISLSPVHLIDSHRQTSTTQSPQSLVPWNAN